MGLKSESENKVYDAKVVIVDYHLGNLFSVQHACKKTGIKAEISSDPVQIAEADALILPGVGAFGDAMKNAAELGIIDPVLKSISTGKPFFGICLGMQLLFDESEEFGNFRGFGVIPGSIRKFPYEYQGASLRVPQIAWNRVNSLNDSVENWKNTPLVHVSPGEYMYFVHSFYAQPESDSYVICKTNYNGFDYCSGVKKDNVFAVQYHPEKSGLKGLEMYQNWAEQNLN